MNRNLSNCESSVTVMHGSSDPLADVTLIKRTSRMDMVGSHGRNSTFLLKYTVDPRLSNGRNSTFLLKYAVDPRFTNDYRWDNKTKELVVRLRFFS